MFGKSKEDVFVSVVKLASVDTFDKKFRSEAGTHDIYESSSSKWNYFGARISVRHQKYVYQKKTEDNIGFRVEINHDVAFINAEWSYQISNGIGYKNQVIFQSQAEFKFESNTARGKLFQHKELQNRAHITVILTIKKWSVTNK